MIGEDKQEEQWVLVEIEPMITAIAETAWCSETKSMNTKDLYTTYIEDGGESIQLIKDEWASMFFGLRQAYSELVQSYILKEDTNATPKARTRDNQRGHPEQNRV